MASASVRRLSAKAVQLPWENVSFRTGIERRVWPIMGSTKITETLPLIEELPPAEPSYADKDPHPKNWFRNAIPHGYTPIQASTVSAFPSLLYPPDFVTRYSGFREIQEAGDWGRCQLAPYRFTESGFRGLGHYGETQAVDPILFFVDKSGEAHFLMVEKEIPTDDDPKKTVTTKYIGGGGLLDPGLTIVQNAIKELNEETLGIGTFPLEIWNKIAQTEEYQELEKAVEEAPIVFAGPTLDQRASADRYMATIGLAVQISEKAAKTLEGFFQTDPEEDCSSPHWFPVAKMDEVEVNPTHRRLLQLAFHHKVRYVHAPSPFWRRSQLMAFRSVMNNLSPESEIDPDWCQRIDSPEIPVLIAYQSSISAFDLWYATEQTTEKQSDLVIIDPKNEQFWEEASVWAGSYFMSYYEHPSVHKLYQFSSMEELKEKSSEIEQLIRRGEKPLVFLPPELASEKPRCAPEVASLITYASEPSTIACRLLELERLR